MMDDIREEGKEMDAFLYPVDIGGWKNYTFLTDEEQKELQRENLFAIEGLFVTEGTLSFIYTRQMSYFYDYIESAFQQIRVVDTTTALENEIYHTTTIEGAKTTRVRTSEIHNGAVIDKNNYESEKMVKNAFDATKMLNLYGNRMYQDTLIKVWNVMVDGCCHNEEIRGEEYRIGSVGVGSHEGIPFEKIKDYMDRWLAFYNSDRFDEKPFIKAAILHYAFENIHPFCDGNGRMGRLLMNNYLIGQGIEACRAVSFSKEIDRTRAHYDAAFVDAENKEADCTPFIEYMLEVMANAAHTALEAVKE